VAKITAGMCEQPHSTVGLLFRLNKSPY